MEIILASKSPRRKDILGEFGYSFSVSTADFGEQNFNKKPKKTAQENALGKAVTVFNNLSNANALVIGADTIVCYKGEILGKPKDKAQAKETLKKLSGKTHLVITAYALISEGVKMVGFDKSKVKFNVLSDSLIDEYVESNSPLDKAGAYGIQDPFPIVKSFKGSLYNVIGLPIEKIKPLIDKIIKKN